VTPEEARRARREFVRKAHPDAGGDPEVFRLGMDAIDAAERRGSASAELATDAVDLVVGTVGQAGVVASRFARRLVKLPATSATVTATGARPTGPSDRVRPRRPTRRRVDDARRLPFRHRCAGGQPPLPRRTTCGTSAL